MLSSSDSRRRECYSVMNARRFTEISLSAPNLNLYEFSLESNFSLYVRSNFSYYICGSKWQKKQLFPSQALMIYNCFLNICTDKNQYYVESITLLRKRLTHYVKTKIHVNIAQKIKLFQKVD